MQPTDHELIRSTLMRYTWSGDNGVLDEFARTFAVDGVLDIKLQGTFTGRDAILHGVKTGFGNAPAALERIRKAGRFSHHVSSTRIELVDAATAQSWSYFAVFGANGADHWGRYTDTLKKIDGEWLLALRRVSVDGAASPSVFFPDFKRA